MMNIGAKLYFDDLDQSAIPPTEKKLGLARFENLPGGTTVKVEVWALGYPGKTYEVQLEKGTTSIVDHVLDYTKGPVIYGVIKDKTITDYFPQASVSITDSLNNVILTETDFKGEYWLGGFIAGNVTLEIFIPFKRKKDIMHLNISQNEIRELNLEY